MAQAYKTTLKAVRQFLIQSQSLFPRSQAERSNPHTTLDMIKRLECVQIDSVSSVTKNQHLVLNARLRHYQPQYLNDLLCKGKVFEHFANAMCVIPIEDYPIFKPVREYLQHRLTPSVENLKMVTHEILERLHTDGPLPSRAFQSTNKVHGYWDNKSPQTKETSHALNLLYDTGMIQVVKREGSDRFFDLTEHFIPKNILDEADAISLSESQQLLIDKYIRAYRIFDGQTQRFGWFKMTASERKAEIDRRLKQEKIIPLDIEGVKRTYYILNEDLEKLKSIEAANPSFSPNNMTFLPPLDNLLWSRDRIEDLFHFNYRWEIYTPREKRRFGPYAMPILWRDQFIGRMDSGLSTKDQLLTVRLLQIEPHIKITATLLKQLQKSIQAFAKEHGAKTITIEKTEPKDLNVL